MRSQPAVPNDAMRQRLAEYGEQLLKMFHAEYEKNPVGAETEFDRGQFISWRMMLAMFYGEAIAGEIIEAVSKKTRLSIPPAGPLSPDGQGYIGWDSGCHMGYIGKME